VAERPLCQHAMKLHCSTAAVQRPVSIIVNHNLLQVQCIAKKNGGGNQVTALLVTLRDATHCAGKLGADRDWLSLPDYCLGSRLCVLTIYA
jgi:hypothetical protein